MQTRYRVVMNGTQLDNCLANHATLKKYKDKIVILNVSYSEPAFKFTIDTAGDNDGGVITKQYREKASVTVTFGIYVYNTADRFAVCQYIKSLINSGDVTITTNDRPGQALYNAVCETYPEIDSARDWTAPLKMVFTKWSNPYWHNTTETERTLAVTKGPATVTDTKFAISGNAPRTNTRVELTINESFEQKTDWNIPNITVTVGKTSVSLCYPFKKNNFCRIGYDLNNILRVVVYDTKASTTSKSILEYVMPSSSDRLLATPGTTPTLKLYSRKKVSARFVARGAWL